MKSFLVLILIIFSLSPSIAQNDSINYRFGFSVSAFSTMNYGFKTFYNLETSPVNDNGVSKIFKDEKYTVDYQNFNFSKDIDIQLSINWINNDNYILRQSFSIFKGKATERVILTLTSYGEKTGIENYVNSNNHSENQYWADNLDVGYQTSFELESNYYGANNSIILFKRFDKKVNFGLGFSSVSRWRDEFYPLFDDGYLQGKYWPPYGSYFTRQLCIRAQIEKSINRFSGFINLSQSIFILKRRKGNREHSEGELIAVSNNLDYRFPLYMKAGLTVSFKKIKRK